MPNWGGIGTYVLQLAENLDDEFDIHVITMKRAGTSAKSLEEIPEKVSVHYVGESKDYFAYNIQFQIDLLRKFESIHKSNRFDLIHANHAQMPDLLLRMMRPKLPVITTVHTTIDSQRIGTASSKLPMSDLERSEKMTFMMLPLLKAIEKAYLRRGRNVIFVSKFIRELYLESNAEPQVSGLIHNGVDHVRFSPRSIEECLEHFPQFEGMERPILFSGRMIALKGLNVAIEAFDQLRKETKAHLIFAGTGKENPWRRMLDQRDISKEDYTFLGTVPYQEMPWLYPLASAFILPSYSESFPMTILEAMACKIPVVATEVGGIPEMIENGRNGLLFRPGDSKGLSDNLLRILGDNSYASKLGENGRERICEEFTSTKMASSTAEMYRKVMEVGA
ncbi:MAG: glycosyltransferase family 4 protein [Methanomassiliicoccales archaeon]|nr:glycosyltransferase family 4 protein [Methanomassiliicoccales archaeon]